MSDSCHEYFILCQPIRECALYRRHVFHAPEWLADEELKEGTILVKDQSKETYALTDRKEIQIGRDVEGLDDKLVQLSNTDAEQLLTITSLEKRYRLFMRLEEQRQKERKVSQLSYVGTITTRTIYYMVLLQPIGAGTNEKLLKKYLLGTKKQ